MHRQEKPNRLFTWLEDHRRFLAATTLIACLGGTATADYISVEHQTGRQSVPAGTCASPFFEAGYRGDEGASEVSQLLGSRAGIVMHVSGEAGVIGVRGAFKAPGDKDWVAISDMLPVDDKHNKDLTFGLGKGDVVFGVQAIANGGSEACSYAPSTVPEVQNIGQYRNRPGQSPWPNPGEFLANAGLPIPPI